MALKKPESMDECIYFTQRTLGDKGFAMVWVLKQHCPKCKKGIVGKPRVKGKVLMRAKEYKCPECSYTAEKKEYEETLTASCEYACPNCGNESEAQAPFKRKKIEGVETLRFQCGKCRGNIDITKKMKEKKSRDGGDEDGD